MQLSGPLGHRAQGRSGMDLSVLTYLNMLGFSYFWCTLLVFFYMCIFVYIPAVYDYESDTSRHMYVASFVLLAQVLVNYFLVIYRKSYFNPSTCQAIPNSTWGKCLDCDAPKPPRTHHCPSCRKCILKRDHHCFLTVSCIGHFNLRYMIVYSYYSALAAALTFYLCYQYCVLQYYYPLSQETWFHYLWPLSVLECLLGKQSWQFMLDVGILYWAFLTASSAVGMGTTQIIFGIFNMTQRDIHHGRLPDMSRARPVMETIRGIFGPWPLLNFVFPLYWTRPKGDGISISDVDEKLI